MTPVRITRIAFALALALTAVLPSGAHAGSGISISASIISERSDATACRWNAKFSYAPNLYYAVRFKAYDTNSNLLDTTGLVGGLTNIHGVLALTGTLPKSYYAANVGHVDMVAYRDEYLPSEIKTITVTDRCK